jgi:hypothetical protein|tara:strand:+ start:49 stop:717 length:669 start_codon:yes stop_codon:yes gene_type:complete
MKLSFNKEKLEEIKDPAPGRKEYYDKSKGKTTPLNQNAGDILKRIQGGNSSFEDAVSASIAKQQTTGANQVSAGNGKGVGVLSGAAAMRSSQAAGAVPGSGGDISELSDRVSALEGGQATSQPGDGPLNGNKVMGVFPNSAQNAAQGVFGSQDQRQQSVGSAPLLQYKDPSIGFIKQRPKEFKTPVYQPDDRPKTKKLQKPNKYTKLVEKKVELKEVINKRL